MKFIIFDLDGTCIDSTHRQNTLPDGSLDLDHWFEHNTPEKIAKDSLLPLANLFKRHTQSENFVIVCTARQMIDADFDFLEANGLIADHIIHRPHGNMEADADLKVKQLREFFKEVWDIDLPSAKAIMFDDNKKVIDAMIANGVACFDARPFNLLGV